MRTMAWFRKKDDDEEEVVFEEEDTMGVGGA